MSFIGNTPEEAWEYWFDELPSEAVCNSLEVLGRTYSTASIIEAIQIAGPKGHISDDDAPRLRYVTGILLRKALESASPELAKLEGDIDTVCRTWRNRKIASWPLNRKYVAEWLKFCEVSEIVAVVHVIHRWSDLKDQMENIKNSRS